MKNIQDNFSKQAATYAQFRPMYPDAIFEFIYRHVQHFDTAWDCATGNGQFANRLAEKFKQVLATDISTKQLEQATPKENILYKIERAEETDFQDDQFDLVTVAQALHWFDFDSFNKEVKRVTRNGGIIAVSSYNLLRIDSELDKLIADFYFNRIGAYWDKERKYVDDDYKNIPFPFEEIQSPSFSIGANWERFQLEGYLNSWSAVHHFIQKEGYNPVDTLMTDISALWGELERKPVYFPLTLRIGRIIK